MRKHLLQALLLITFITLFPAKSFAYTITEVGGDFDGTYLSIACGSVPNYAYARQYLNGVGTTTYPLYLDLGEGTQGWGSPQNSQDYCTANNLQKWPISSMAGQPAGTYYYFVSYTGEPPDWPNSSYYYMPFTWNGTTVTDFLYDTQRTRFISLSPSNMETVATTTYTFHGADFYVNPKDYQSDLFLRFKWKRNNDDQAVGAYAASQGGIWNTYDFPTNDWNVLEGLNRFATTTIFDRGGQYTFTAELRKPTLTNKILGFFGFDGLYDNGLIVASTTQFIAGEMTPYDRFVASTTAQFDAYNNATSTGTASLEQVKADCNPVSFSLTGCLNGLLGFNGAGSAFVDMRDNLLVYAPMGYITRFMTIAAGGGTTTIPAITYTFGTNTALSGDTVTIDVFKYAGMATGTILGDLKSDQPVPKTLWQIFEPFYTTVIYLGLAFIIIGDIMGIALHGQGTGVWNKKRGLTRDEYRYKEKLLSYKMRGK